MLLRRIATVVAVGLFGMSLAFGSRSSAQEVPQATPVAEGDVCFFPPEAPLTVQVQAGQEAVITFDSDCQPIFEFFDIATSEDTTVDAESALAPLGNARTGPAPGGDDGRARLTHTGSSVCNSSMSVHDLVHIQLTHQRVYGRWYWNDHAVTGRGNGSTSEQHLMDGWEVVDGPWFFWYQGPVTPQGAEGWTAWHWFGYYWHEARAIIWMSSWGNCWADHYWSGSIPNNGHLHQRVYIS